MKKSVSFYIILLLFFGLIIRLSLMNYGLPLWLINDEPSTILGSLKMIELKSVLPFLHTDEMKSVLYYPPYISYLYLIPFVIILSISYLLHGVPLETFTAITTSNLSIFFITARLVSIVISLLGIYLIYKSARNIFISNKAAFFTAFFGSTSLLFTTLSVNARHWIYITFIYILTFYVLTTKLPLFKKYFLSGLVAALGMGISSISTLLFILLPLWYFIYEHNSLKELQSFLYIKKTYYALLSLILLSLLPTLLYPQSNGFIIDLTTKNSKPFIDALLSPFYFIETIFFSETVLIIFAFIGLCLLIRNNKRFVLTCTMFIFVYSLTFYSMFRFESRFLLPILPLFFIFAGYAAQKIFDMHFVGKVFVSILFIFPIISSLSLARLGIINDSRIHAIKWVHENITLDKKIITYGSQLRLPANKAAVQELEAIDSNALRKVDNSEKKLSTVLYPLYHSLNIYTVKNDEFFMNLDEYIIKNKYDYLIVEQGGSNVHKYIEKALQSNFEKVASVGNNRTRHSIAISEFRGDFFDFLEIDMLGPKIDIYKLR